jgi:Domain of unknown function (DUF4136)
MKMEKLGRLFRVVVAGCALLLCGAHAAAQDVRYNYLPGTDFSKYLTYKWVQVPNVQYPNQLVDAQIKQSIDGQLALKGLRRIEGDNPDLYVVYQAAVNQEKQWNAYSSGGGGYWGYGGWGGWGGMGGMETTTVTSSTINVGSLNVDLYDVATKKQVWRGEATKTLKNEKKPEKRQKNLDKAMAKLMKNYPPPKKN